MIPLSRSAAVAALAGVAIAVACGTPSPTMPPFDGAIAIGTWGGDSAGMVVTGDALHLHIACTFGDFGGRLHVEPDGTFDVSATYMLRAYPVAIGPSLPARLVGKLEGSRVTVTAIVDDTVEGKTVVRGPVIVRYGDQPRLGPCPICSTGPATAARP